MFDYVDHKAVSDPGRPRYLTAGVSAVMHVVVIGLVVGLPILYASSELPEPPSMMAFVMDAVPPPPPPPPPAPAPATPAPKKVATTPKPDTPVIEQPKPIAQANPVAAPVEAPAAVTPETGLEANAGAARPAIEAGFESGISGGVAGGVVGGIAGGIDGAPPPPPPSAKPQGPVRVGGQVKAPQLTRRVNPVYPPMAQSANIEGSVVLEAQVNTAGRVESVRVVRGHSLLDEAAIAAVKQWQYQPLTLNGQPVEFILTVTVSFSIPR